MEAKKLGRRLSQQSRGHMAGAWTGVVAMRVERN